MNVEITAYDEQDEIDRDLWLWNAEREWHRKLPRHSDVEWLHIFPAAKARWGRIIKMQLQAERAIQEQNLQDMMYFTTQELKINKEPYRDDLLKDYYQREKSRLEREIRAIDGRLVFLKTIGSSKKPVDSAQKKQVTADMVIRAKEYPIEQLVEMNRAGFARCIWHEDTKPSMFCKKNFAHCFVCQKSGDTIAIVMEQEGLSFQQAVLRLQH